MVPIGRGDGICKMHGQRLHTEFPEWLNLKKHES